MRKEYSVGLTPLIKQQLLQWCSTQRFSCFLDSNTGHHKVPVKYDLIAAAGKHDMITGKPSGLEDLQAFINEKRDWLFGYLSYDLKNDIEQVFSANEDHHNAAPFCFFQPEYIFSVAADTLTVLALPHLSCERVIEEIMQVTVEEPSGATDIKMNPRISKQEYIDNVKKLGGHIQQGDIYEVNFCHEFYSGDAVIDPVHVYNALNSLSHSPFSAFCRFDESYLLSASPERFIAREGVKILSQPIKGTARRGRTKEQDEVLRAALAASAKERSENVMIVDLVRNDLARIAKRGSVKVDELFGIYTFEQVHQMISTVSAEVRSDISFVDIIRAAFPMGSMTGAPKVRAMQLIEEHESTRRGLYSGSVGYIAPSGDLDFNVVIRSILYNAASKYVSFMVGGAITAGSVPGEEYEECMLKAAAMLKALNNTAFV